MAYAYQDSQYRSQSPSGSSIAPTASHYLRESVSRKGSEGFDVIKEFKHKVEEDEHYIDFFLERIRVEEAYIFSLNRLLDRTTAVDTLHDDAKKNARESSRRAWYEVRDYTSVEIQSRMAMVGALKGVVVPELQQLRDEQTRIRQNLKENIRHANEMYDDHAHSRLPKLKRSYWAKCQAVEDHKRQEAAILAQARLLSTPSPTSPAGTPLHEHPNTISYGNPVAGLSPPASTPPLPPMTNPAVLAEGDVPRPIPTSVSFSTNTGGVPGPSTGGGGGGSKDAAKRNRAGSAGQGEKKDPKEVLQDFAQQSKKGFNSLMQKLGGDRERERERHERSGSVAGGEREEGGFVFVGDQGEDKVGTAGVQRRGTSRGSLSGKAGDAALRAVKTKREADDADKAYRRGVFELETLRLRREKLQSSALISLESFSQELNVKLRTALERYIDTLHGTAATNAQSTGPAQSAIDEINDDYDMTLFRTRLRGADTRTGAAPVPYENYYVGACKSLIFGVSLTDYDFARGEGGDRGTPPVIVDKCISAIDEKGLDAEGIYRISGRKAGIQKMIQDIELDEGKFLFTDKDDVFSISNVLKQYLRELPEPVFPLPHPERVKYTENRESHISSNFSALRGRLRRLPFIHQTTFRAIIEHLGRVQHQSSVNKMDAKNLAVVFNSVLFGQDVPTDGNVLTMHLEKDTVLEDLITYSDLLFSAEEPLPPAVPVNSGLSRSGIVSQSPIDDGPQPGSSRTKFKLLDASAGLPRTSSDSTFSPTASNSLPPLAPPTAGAGVTGAPQITVNIATSPIATKPEIMGEGTVFTPDEELELLFDPTVIPGSLQESLGAEYHARPLSSTDLLRSHFGLLSTLTSAPAIAPSVYQSLFSHLKSCSGTYYILVIVSRATDQLVAAGTLLVERKYIHGGGIAGHIEDIVVSPETRGQGLGLKLVTGLREMATGLGCYKTILDCQEGKIPFYEKCGFKLRGTQMAFYTSNSDTSPFIAPSVPAPGTASKHGSNLALPSLANPPRSPAPPLPPRPVEAPGFIDLTSERPTSPDDFQTASSEYGGITYDYPTAMNIIRTAVDPRGMDMVDGIAGVGAYQHRQLSESESESGASDHTAEPDFHTAAPDSPTQMTPVAPKRQASLEETEGLGPTRAEKGKEKERAPSPLPPGAAPPVLSNSPEQIRRTAPE